ncbi:unnamed protein product [Candida verbasci]|uniref:RNA-binding protein n=1 Tax=Candida verbasci TaxID=1227364 RepID=A0A9W4TUW5_9ASCO|nr:unnamed protein product [Candida verbasci]
MSDFYIIIHIATTCDNTSLNCVAKDSTELIEFAWSTIDATTLEILHQETILVRPINTPITPYCSQLHGISWEHVRNANTFKDAIVKFDSYMQQEVIKNDTEFCLITFDISKLKIQLSREARDKSVVLPSYLQHPRVFDFPNEYLKWQKSHPEALSYTASSLSNIITALEVEVKNIDSFANTSISSSSTPPPSYQQQQQNETQVNESETKAKSLINLYSQLVTQLMKKSLPIEDHPDVFTKPYDLAQDAQVFLSERSKILYLSNLSSDTTQSELESWFTQYGGRPVAFWTLKNLENNNDNKSNKKGISGFAIFGTHEEAAESLAMNGRLLSDRAIEVEPSSSRVLDKASELLTPFPPSKNRPRPGDWTCPSCGFSNFQRRTHCFRCSFPASSAVAIQESMYSKNNNSRRINNITTQPVQVQQQPQPQPIQQQLPVTTPFIQQDLSNQENINQNQNRSHYNSSVPFRAGDWKCDLCSYHNFAKNLCCLKCSAAKPIVKINQLHNSIHSVNSTAAAIAAATASGQPLNVSNGFMNLQQPQPHHYNQQQQQQRQFRNGYNQQQPQQQNYSQQYQKHQFQQLNQRSANTPPVVSQVLMYNQQSNQLPNSGTPNSNPEIATPSSQQRFSSAVVQNSPGLYSSMYQNSFNNRSNKSLQQENNSSALQSFSSLNSQMNSLNLN